MYLHMYSEECLNPWCRRQGCYCALPRLAAIALRDRQNAEGLKSCQLIMEQAGQEFLAGASDMCITTDMRCIIATCTTNSLRIFQLLLTPIATFCHVCEWPTILS